MSDSTKPEVGAVPVPVAFNPTPSDVVMAREGEFLRKKLQADDKARASSERVTLVATAAFTLIDDPDFPEGETIKAGQEFEISAIDLPAYIGRGVPKSLEPGPGVNVKQG